MQFSTCQRRFVVVALLGAFGGEPAPAQSGDAPSESAERVICRMGGPEGARRYRPGVWSLVEVHAINETGEPVEAQAVLRFVADPTLQFGRRVWVPAKAQLRTTCPILIPRFSASNYRVDFVAEQVEPPEPDNRRLPHESIRSPKAIILNHEVPSVGLIADLGFDGPPPNETPYFTGKLNDPPFPDQAVYELVLAAKRARRLTRRVSVFEAGDLPPDRSALDVLDVLVLSTDRLATDPGGTALLRDWVLGGGQLWIMLDEVQPDTVGRIMGDAFATTVIDRVGLTSADIENVRSSRRYRDTEGVDFDEPVEFVRVIPKGVNITDTVNGLPATFWQPFGAGRVFFSTLGPAAWMRPTTLQDPPAVSEDDFTLFFPRDPLRYFAEDFLVPRQSPELDSTSFHPFLSEQIGYRIVSRRAVTGILGLFCLAVAAACVWFSRTGRAERALWAIPLAAVSTCLVFLGIAAATKRSVPPSVATIARVVLEAGVGTGHTFGLVAMYNQDANRGHLAATQGGIFFPDMTAMSGRRRRLTWTDEGAWHWEELELPAGVRTAPFQHGVSWEKTVDCRAQFGPGGLRGFIGQLPFTNLEDVLIALPHQSVMAVNIRHDGTFTTAPDDVLARGTYMAGNWLGDQHRRRKGVYERLFRRLRDAGSSTPPILFAWADAWDLGFVFPQTNQLGSTLLSVPVRMEKSPAGTYVDVPSPFIPYRAVPGPDGRQPIVYGNLMRQWLETKRAATDWLRFQLPSEVLPIKIRRATLHIEVKAPSRSLEVLALNEDQPIVVARLSRPIGAYPIVLERSDSLQVDDDGGLLLALRVSDDEAAHAVGVMSQAPWKVESLRLEVAGTVQGEPHE